MAYGQGFGVSFLPGQEQNGDRPQGPGLNGPGVSPVQQAIRFLSLRLPRFAGVNAIAPPALLNAAGGAGLDPAMASLGGGGGSDPGLARLLGLLGGRGAPPPRVGPGVTQPPPDLSGGFGTVPPPSGPTVPSGPPPYQPGESETSRGGGPFYRDPNAPVTGQAVPRAGSSPDQPIGGLSPQALLDLFARTRRGGYTGPGGVGG